MDCCRAKDEVKSAILRQSRQRFFFPFLQGLGACLSGLNKGLDLLLSEAGTFCQIGPGQK